MRTNVDIDDELMQQAMRQTGARTKKAVVEAGLRSLIQINAQKGILKFKGKVDWDGDSLEEGSAPLPTSPHPW